MRKTFILTLFMMFCSITFGQVAKINETGEEYATLAEAISWATSGQTITFLSDITEKVEYKITKSITIDGKGYTFSGNMIIQASLIVRNLNFDGKGYNVYALQTSKNSNVSLTVEDCTLKSYGYGFMQLSKGVSSVSIKNVTVTDVAYGVKLDYGNSVTLDNVNIEARQYALWNSNYGQKTIKIKNCKLNIVGSWIRNKTTKTYFEFEGNNEFGDYKASEYIDEVYGNETLDFLQLKNVNSTLKGPGGVKVTTAVAGKCVVYEEDVYHHKAQMSDKDIVAKVASTDITDDENAKYFTDLSEAVKEAANGVNNIFVVAHSEGDGIVIDNSKNSDI